MSSFFNSAAGTARAGRSAAARTPAWPRRPATPYLPSASRLPASPLPPPASPLLPPPQPPLPGSARTSISSVGPRPINRNSRVSNWQRAHPAAAFQLSTLLRASAGSNLAATLSELNLGASTTSSRAPSLLDATGHRISTRPSRAVSSFAGTPALLSRNASAASSLAATPVGTGWRSARRLYTQYRSPAQAALRSFEQHTATSRRASRNGDVASTRASLELAGNSLVDAAVLHSVAADRIFAAVNAPCGAGTIDLHGLHELEAVERVRAFLLSTRLDEVTVVTGVGTHSHVRPTIKIAVRNWLMRNGFRFRDSVNGRGRTGGFVVKVKRD